MNTPLRTLEAYGSLIVAAVTCPCHIPIALALLGGTAVGVFLSNHLLLLVVVLTVIFLLTLIRGLKLINETKTEQRQ